MIKDMLSIISDVLKFIKWVNRSRLFERNLLLAKPYVYSVYIATKCHSKRQLKNQLRNIFTDQKIILKDILSERSDNGKHIFKLQLNTGKVPEEFISSVQAGFLNYNNNPKCKDKEVLEYVACQRNNDIKNIVFPHKSFPVQKNSSEEFLKETIIQLCKEKNEPHIIDKKHFVFLWNGPRLEIPFTNVENTNLRQHPHRLHLLMPNFLDSALCVFTPYNYPSTKNVLESISKKASNIDKLEKRIKKICNKLIFEMKKQGIFKSISEGKKNCRLSLFYYHHLFEKICGKSLVPYFTYRADIDQNFNYWNIEDLAEDKTLYSEGLLHIGKCYSYTQGHTWVYVLTDKACKTKDEDIYTNAWVSCHSDKEDEKRIGNIVTHHHTKSQAHIGIRICKKEIDDCKHRFVLCFDIISLNMRDSDKNDRAKLNEMQKKLKEIIDDNYDKGVNIRGRLEEFCEHLYCEDKKEVNSEAS